MSYYHFNRKEILQKAKERHSEEKAAEYYLQNKEVIKEKSKNQNKKEALQNKWVLLLLSIRMSEKTLKFNNIRLNKNKFIKSKQPIDLMSVNTEHVVTSDKFKHSEKGFKYFIGFREGEILKLLCIILPQMNGHIKYFENGGKNISFVVKGGNVLGKYNKILDKIKEKLNIKFHRMPVYDKTYIKVKVR